MNTVTYGVTGFLKVKHSHGKKVSCSTLYSGLEDTTANQVVPAPLPSKSILAVDGDTHLLTPPGSYTQLELWPLPANDSATGEVHP